MKEWLIKLGKVAYYGLIFNGKTNYSDVVFYRFGLSLFIIGCISFAFILVTLPILFYKDKKENKNE